MGADDEGLFHVGGLERTGDKNAENPLGKRSSAVLRSGRDSRLGSVDVVDDRAARHHQDEVLAEKIEDSLRHVVVGNPNGGVFGHAEFAVKDYDIAIR